MDHLAGPKTFVLAGSGHIAGVVNPLAAGKYQYWTGDNQAATLDDFVAGASATKGSWWPHWIGWIAETDDTQIAVQGPRITGTGKQKAIDDTSGRYVQQRKYPANITKFGPG